MSIRFTHGDKQFKRFMSLIDEGFRLFGSIVLVNFIPIMKYLPGLTKIRNKIKQNRDEMACFFQETIDKHRSTLDENNVRDLVDAYLIEIKNAKAEGRETKLFQGRNHGKFISYFII